MCIVCTIFFVQQNLNKTNHISTKCRLQQILTVNSLIKELSITKSTIFSQLLLIHCNTLVSPFMHIQSNLTYLIPSKFCIGFYYPWPAVLVQVVVWIFKSFASVNLIGKKANGVKCGELGGLIHFSINTQQKLYTIIITYETAKGLIHIFSMKFLQEDFHRKNSNVLEYLQS